MRNLHARDLFTFSRMITKMGIKDELKNFLNPQNGNDNEDENTNNEKNGTGLELIMTILSKLPDAENEFFEFLAPICEKTIEETKDIPLIDLIQTLKDIWRDSGILSFFT